MPLMVYYYLALHLLVAGSISEGFVQNFIAISEGCSKEMSSKYKWNKPTIQPKNFDETVKTHMMKEEVSLESSSQEDILNSSETSTNEVNNKHVIKKSIQNIVEKQRTAFQYFQFALMRFQSVTDDLQRLLENVLNDQLDANSSVSGNIEKEKQLNYHKYGRGSPARKRARHKYKKYNEETLDKLLYVKNDKIVGKSVLSSETILKGRRVTEYVGVVYQKQIQEPAYDPYIYEFNFQGKNLCIDPSSHDCKAKYIRHEALNPNCRVELEFIEDIPRLFFYSVRDIHKDEVLSCNFLMGSCKRINLDTCLTLLEEQDNQNLIPLSAVFVKEEPYIENPDEENSSVASPPMFCTTEFDTSQGEFNVQSTSSDAPVEESFCQSDMEMLSKWKSKTNSVAKSDDTDKIVVKQYSENEFNGAPSEQHEESEKDTHDVEQLPLQNKKAFLSRIQLSDVESLSNSVNKEKLIYKPNNISDIESRPSCSRVTSKHVAVSKQYLPESFSPYVQPVLEGNWDNPVHHKKMISQLAKEIVIFLNDEGLMESSDSIVRRKEYRLLEQELTTNYPKLVTYLGNESGRLKHSRKGCHSDFVKKIASRRRQEKFQINQRQREPPHSYQRSLKTMGPEDYWTLLQKMSLDELNDAAEGKSSVNILFYLRATFDIRRYEFPTKMPLYLMQKPHFFEELSLRMGKSINEMKDDLENLLLAYSQDQGGRQTTFVEIEEYLHESTKSSDEDGRETNEDDTTCFLELNENFNYDPTIEDVRSGCSVVLSKGELFLNDTKRFHKIYGTFTETEAVLTGFGAYYIFNKEYPDPYRQFLGLLEIKIRPSGTKLPFREEEKSDKLKDLCNRLEL